MLRDALLRSALQHEVVLVTGVRIHNVKQPAKLLANASLFAAPAGPAHLASLFFAPNEGAERRDGAAHACEACANLSVRRRGCLPDPTGRRLPYKAGEARLAALSCGDLCPRARAFRT